tara:strand:+ start:616 stop:819 length:204 start_codon:yes stop_codon:yes gene_type:complete
MKINQKLTPKYWIAHDNTTGDVWLDTADKSLVGCRDKLKHKFDGWDIDNDEDISLWLFEVKPVEGMN